MRILIILTLAACSLSTSQAYTADSNVCKNPGGVRYKDTPARFFAPMQTRALGFYIEADSTPRRPPDLRPECLPLPIRYNNPGALQTPHAGPWHGQTDKDSKGHAVFPEVTDGVAAWLLWVKKRTNEGKNTAYKLMSMYAPPDDCVGTVDKLSNGECPPGFPLNDTIGYATRVAKAFGVGPHDRLVFSGASCDNRKGLRTFFREVMKVELGQDFCNKSCDVDSKIFNNASNMTFGSALSCP